MSSSSSCEKSSNVSSSCEIKTLCEKSSEKSCSSNSDFTNLHDEKYDFCDVIKNREQDSTSLDFSDNCNEKNDCSSSSSSSNSCAKKAKEKSFYFNNKAKTSSSDSLILFNLEERVKIKNCQKCLFSGVDGKKKFCDFENANFMDNLYCLEHLHIGKLSGKKHEDHLTVEGSCAFNGKVKISELEVDKINGKNAGNAEHQNLSNRPNSQLEYTPANLPQTLYVDTCSGPTTIVLGTTQNYLFNQGQKVTIKNCNLAMSLSLNHPLHVRLPHNNREVKLEHLVNNTLTSNHHGSIHLPTGACVTLSFYQFNSHHACWMIEQIFLPTNVNYTSPISFPQVTDQFKYALLNKNK